MTKEEFVYYLKRKRDKFDIWRGYLTSIAIICCGFYVIYIWEADFSFAIILLILYIFLAGTYGFWRIPATYILSEHSTKKSFNEIVRILDTYLQGKYKYRFYPHDVYLTQPDGSTPTFKFKNNLMSHNYEIVLHLNQDDHKLYIHVNTIGSGIMDFGASRREHKKLDRYLKSQLQA